MGTRTLGWSDHADSLVEIDNDQARSYLDKHLTVWVDVNTTDSAEIARLHREFGVHKEVLADAAGPPQLPKLETYGDCVFVILHGIYMEHKVLKTTQVNCVVTQDLFLTIADRAVPGLDWLWGAIAKPSVRRSSSPDELLGHLAEVIAHRYLAVINQFDDQIDDVYEEALTARRQVLTQVQALRKETASISKVSRPQRVVLNDLVSLDNPVIGDGRPLLRDAFDVQNMVVESLRSTRSMLADTLDTYRGATGDRQSTASTVLAVYSAVMLPLTFITGFFGMNVDLPGMHYKPAWIVLVVFMLLIAVVSMAIFIKVGFVRLPQRNRNSASAQAADGIHIEEFHGAGRDQIDAHVAAYDDEDATNVSHADRPTTNPVPTVPGRDDPPQRDDTDADSAALTTTKANTTSSSTSGAKRSAVKKLGAKKPGAKKSATKKSSAKKSASRKSASKS